MAIAVDASNQVGGMAPRAGVAHRGWNVADAYADAPVTSAIGVGLMDAERVVQGELSGGQAAVDRMDDVARVVNPLLGVVDARLHAIGVHDLAAPMAAWKELHAAAADRSIRQREPRGVVQVVRLEAEVGSVLVPASD